MRTTPARREIRVTEAGLPRARRQDLAEGLGRRLLLATDLSEGSRAAEERAIALAVEGGRELVILGVVTDPVAAASARGMLRTLADTARWRGATVDARLLVSDDPADAILGGVATHDADAIVIAHATWCDRPGRAPVCGHLVNTAPCPILVIGSHAGR